MRDRADSSVPATARLLEIDPGRGELRWFRKLGFTSVPTFDIRPGILMSLMDITRTALRDGVSDVIVCSHVLEHVPEDWTAMREMRRALKTARTCFVQVPFQEDLAGMVEYGAPNRDEFDHFRAYGQDFNGRLETAGFVVSHSDGELFEVTKVQ